MTGNPLIWIFSSLKQRGTGFKRRRPAVIRRAAIGLLLVGMISWIPGMSFADGSATLAAGSGSGEPGDTAISIPVSLDSSQGTDVSGLNFDMAFDTSRLVLREVRDGPEAIDADKDVSSSTPSSGTVRVIVFGVNQNSIGDGVVAFIVFDIKTTASPGTVSLPLSNASATSPDGSNVSLSTNSGSLTVESPPATSTSTATPLPSSTPIPASPTPTSTPRPSTTSTPSKTATPTAGSSSPTPTTTDDTSLTATATDSSEADPTSTPISAEGTPTPQADEARVSTSTETSAGQDSSDNPDLEFELAVQETGTALAAEAEPLTAASGSSDNSLSISPDIDASWAAVREFLDSELGLAFLVAVQIMALLGILATIRSMFMG